MLAYAPHFPVPRQEYWYFVLAEPAENAVLGMARVSLMEAEALAAAPESQQAKPPKAAAKPLANGAAQQAAAADGDSTVRKLGSEDKCECMDSTIRICCIGYDG